MSEKNTIPSMNGKEERKKTGKKKTGSLAAAVIVLLAMIIGCVIYFNSDDYRISRQLDLGQRYLVECDYGQAIVAFQEVIDIDPMSVDAYLGMAEAYEGMGDYAMAIKTLTQGHEITGDERLQAKKDEVENLKAEAEAPEQIITEPETARETDIENQEQDAVLEEAYVACVVDGIYHNGYTLHDLSDEERMLLDDLITYTEDARYRECVELLSDDRYVEIAVKYCDDETDGTYGMSHIAYSGYKIYFEGGWDNELAVYLIPVADGIGAMYYYGSGSDSEDKWLFYCYCDCVDGMYNGNYYCCQFGTKSDDNIYRGGVRNGLLDGETFRQYRDFNWHATFVDGKPQSVEYKTKDDGMIAMYYWYYGENGNASGGLLGSSIEKVDSLVFYLTPFPDGSSV